MYDNLDDSRVRFILWYNSCNYYNRKLEMTEEVSRLWKEGSERMNMIGREGNDGLVYGQSMPPGNADAVDFRDLRKEQGPKPTKSDGGSSSYYKFEIPEHGDIQVEDIIRYMVGNDFDLGNIVKAARRIYMDSIGEGKVGTSAKYDWNKIKYTAEKNLKWIGESNEGKV